MKTTIPDNGNFAKKIADTNYAQSLIETAIELFLSRRSEKQLTNDIITTIFSALGGVIIKLFRNAISSQILTNAQVYHMMMIFSEHFTEQLNRVETPKTLKKTDLN